jgi:hypothetical protein
MHPHALFPQIVRILYMVPIYAISSWLSLAIVHYAPFIEFLRACYEAYVIYAFMLLLTEYMGGHEGVVSIFSEVMIVSWPEPMCCMRPTTADSKFLHALKYGALQYVVASPLLGVVSVGLYTFDLYVEGEIRWDRG